MATDIPDPVKAATSIICGVHNTTLERRLKQDIITSIGRIKPDIAAALDFESDVMSGDAFSTLSAPLQGIAIAKVEGALAFYNRVGWNPQFLQLPLETCISGDGVETLKKRYHARNLHDLAYVHPKHFEKMLGKAGAASMWEALKRQANTGSDEASGST